MRKRSAFLIFVLMIPESVAGAIFSQNRTQILLIQRRDVPVWVLPGGGIDPSETPEQAIVREILEETGFRVKIVRCAGVYTPINRLARFTLLYECAIIDGKAILSEETRGVRFFSLETLPPMPPPYLDWIQDALPNHQPTVHKNLDTITYATLVKLFFLHPLLILRFILSRLGFPINT